LAADFKDWISPELMKRKKTVWEECKEFAYEYGEDAEDVEEACYLTKKEEYQISLKEWTNKLDIMRREKLNKEKAKEFNKKKSIDVVRNWIKLIKEKVARKNEFH
jgi:hypothetical protein